jgi:hypothetical protein
MGRLALMWVFAFLLLLCNLARAEDKADPVADYKTFLTSLPKDDPASVTKATDQYRAAVIPLDMDKHAKAFLAFLDFHAEVCDGVGNTLGKKPNEGAICADYTDVFEREEARRLSRYGLKVRGNGCDGYYVAAIPEYVPRMFSAHMPKSIQRYLDLREVETRVDYQVDAALLISYAQVAQRVADWDRYLRNYPDSPMRVEAMVLRAQYLLDLLAGMANSPLNPATEDPSGNIRVVYQEFLQTHPGTYAGKLVRQQYDYLRKKGFFSKPFDAYDRTACDRHDEIRNYLCRTINLDEYWMNPESGYRLQKTNSK